MRYGSIGHAGSARALEPGSMAGGFVRQLTGVQRPVADSSGGIGPEKVSELTAVIAEREALAGRLARLERMLADPEKGENAILYYRLRAVWQFCHDDLVLLAQGSRSKFDVGDTAGRDESAVAAKPGQRRVLERELETAQAEERALRERIKRLRHDLYELERPFRPGEKQTLTAALKEAEPRLAALTIRCNELRTSQEQSEPESPVAPASQKVVTARRAINALLVALAQHYYLLFREDQIADMALHAARTPVEDAYFGLTSECLELQRKIRELLAWARSEQGRGEALQLRAKYLRTRLRYQNQESAMPLRNSLGWMPVQIGRQYDLLASPDELLSVNVLAQDYWDLSQVLLD